MRIKKKDVEFTPIGKVLRAVIYYGDKYEFWYPVSTANSENLKGLYSYSYTKTLERKGNLVWRKGTENGKIID